MCWSTSIVQGAECRVQRIAADLSAKASAKAEAARTKWLAWLYKRKKIFYFEKRCVIFWRLRRKEGSGLEDLFFKNPPPLALMCVCLCFENSLFWMPDKSVRPPLIVVWKSVQSVDEMSSECRVQGAEFFVQRIWENITLHFEPWTVNFSCLCGEIHRWSVNRDEWSEIRETRYE